MEKNSNHNRPLPYSIILAAKVSDAEAMQAVFRHNEGYIRMLSLQPVYDGYGNQHSFVDETIRGELENHLALAIIEHFRVVPDE